MSFIRTLNPVAVVDPSPTVSPGINATPRVARSAAAHVGLPITVWSLDDHNTPDLEAVLQLAGPLGHFLNRDRCLAIAARLGARLHYLVAFAADEPVGLLPLAELSADSDSRLVSFPESPVGGPLARDERVAAALCGRARRLAARRSVAAIQVSRCRRVAEFAAPPAAPPWIVLSRHALDGRFAATSTGARATPQAASGRTVADREVRVERVGKAAYLAARRQQSALSPHDATALLRAALDASHLNGVDLIAIASGVLSADARRALLELPDAQIGINELIW